MKGQKFSQDKLPLGTMILTQFPKALMEVARASAAGHRKYIQGDEDWLNFSRVENPKFQYTNAALRHLMEAETHTFNEDMKEYDPKVRHLAQSAWNILCRLEVELREEVTKLEEKINWGSVHHYKGDECKRPVDEDYLKLSINMYVPNTPENKVMVDEFEKSIEQYKVPERLSINELLSSNKENEDYFPDSLV